MPRKSKILTITPHRKNTYKITTSSGIVFRIPEKVSLQMSLMEGGELSDSDIDLLNSSTEFFKARDMALTMLNYRMRSKKELELKLIKKGNKKNTISKVIQHLEDKGWLMMKILFSVYRDQINRNRIGPIALKYKLKEHIDFDLIEEISDRIFSDINIEDIIMQVLVKYSRENKKEEDLKEKSLVKA